MAEHNVLKMNGGRGTSAILHDVVLVLSRKVLAGEPWENLDTSLASQSLLFAIDQPRGVSATIRDLAVQAPG
jgi:hypothetical protein